MRHFYRTHLTPAEVLTAADEFFEKLGLAVAAREARERTYRGVVGTPEVPAAVQLRIRPEGGHYTFVEVTTDQVGESRIDRNVKRFFVDLHRRTEPTHRPLAAY